MKTIIVVLVILIAFILCYVFLEKAEIKRLKKELDFIMSNDTNRILHTEFNSKELKEFVSAVNMYLSEIQKRKTEIEHKNNNLMVMMRNISHDLRTPLTSAAGYTDLILNSDLTEDEKISEMKIVEARLKRLTELVDSFFEFSKILTTNKEIELETVNLIGILEECIGNFYEDYKKENREVDFITSNNKISISTNRTMLSRIFENLISNALKYGSGNLTIEVISENADVIRISFTNRIIDKDLDTGRIFDDFYTTDISRTKGSTGLGLAIAKEFTEQLNGNIEAHIEDDKLVIDTTFVLI
ncbi:sensor histidine kinase [Bovifimicola ammoniilytica]|jgi:Signal transduction histidine kinase|uniref:sensor histidine kinase n=1 Tax=Bovifimicola ammoniilytica TaxID=2981720 RepID=UPI00033B0BF3|nr:HAMP domain-containing sensor histidine kinase [Bovifimicola ammoniilytica]MCU6752931.1 HAMP domain-containing histidine kinase [Bovifimicola ammoniilytica]CCZ03021.1 aTPase/histidine kinase/DNA gyrase B/HSP90 domain protein [Eubacterium sp. CAG:603]SCJ45325.1 Histidine protein kinase saeS [uncultured Eubacterium sp.]